MNAGRLLYILLICIAPFLTTIAALGQTTQQKIDSLLAVLPKAKHDTGKALLLAQISGSYFQINAKEGIIFGKQALALSDSLHFDRGGMLANMALGKCYGISGANANALKSFDDALAIAKKLNDKVTTAKALQSLGLTYQANEDYQEALAHFERAEALYKAAGMKNYQQVLNNIGSMYLERKEYKKGLPYLQRAIAMELADKAEPAALLSLYNNIGTTLVSLHRYDSGLYYLFAALPLIDITGNMRSAAYTHNNIANAYYELSVNGDPNMPDSLKNKQLNLSLGLMHAQKALSLNIQLGQTELQLYTLTNIANIYELQGNYQEALKFQKRYMETFKEIFDFEKTKDFADMAAALKVQKTTDSLNYQNKMKDSQLKQKRIERNGIIILIVLIGVISILLINRQKLKHMQNLKMAESDKLRMAELAKQQLADFTVRIQEKNQLIEAITAEIEQQRELNSQQSAIDYTLLAELQQSILLTDEQWDKFKNTFDKVYTGYLIRLKEKISDVSPAEIRFVLLSKLKLSNKEMGAMLGVGAKAVRAHKYRLMKKLDIEDDAVLDKLIQDI